MDVRISRTLKAVLISAAIIAVVVMGANVFSKDPVEKHHAKEVEKLDVNSYNPEEVNSFVFGKAAMESVRVRRYVDEGILSDLWMSVEREKDVNLLIVYNIPVSGNTWKRISHWMPMDDDSPYSPDLVEFTEDALRSGACVANITNVQGDIVICVGADKEAALNAIRDYAMNNMKCKEQDDCAVNAIDDALERDVDTAVILYVGEKGKVLKIFEPKSKTMRVWYKGVLIKHRSKRF